MSCKKYQKQLITQIDSTGELKQHVESCQACHSFAKSVKQFQAFEKAILETPTVLYENTKVEAFSVYAATPIHKTNFIKTLWNSPKFVIGLAVTFLAIFIIAFNTNLISENEFLKNLNWTVFVTIIIQNMIMAIFIPIFFSFKNNIFHISKRS